MIYACDEQGAIGKDGDLPWRQSTDLQHFKRITLNKSIVMGRKLGTVSEKHCPPGATL